MAKAKEADFGEVLDRVSSSPQKIRKVWKVVGNLSASNQRQVVRAMLAQSPAWSAIAKALQEITGESVDGERIRIERVKKDPQLDWCTSWDEAKRVLAESA